MLKALLILGLGSVLALPAAPPFALNSPNQTPNKHELRALARTTGDAMRLLLARRGVKTIDGKPLFGGHGRVNNPTLKDIPIAANPAVNEWIPDLVLNPRNKMIFVASAQYADGADYTRCAIYRTTDAGKTWSPPILLPQRNASESSCTAPRLRYSADGSTIALSFINFRYQAEFSSDWLTVIETTTWDIDITQSNDDGLTWSSPVNAIPGVPVIHKYTRPSPDSWDWTQTVVQDGTFNDCQWVGISEDGKHVYASASTFWWYIPDTVITFAVSHDHGATFTRKGLDNTYTWDDFMQYPRIATSPGGHVLVAWYHSGNDAMLRGGFWQRVAYSSDFGATFSPASTAVRDSFELPAYLGPDGVYRLWWGATFPVIEIDANGAAHMVYTHDPEANVPCTSHWNGFGNDACSTTTEDGDIRYSRSPGPPYTEWSQPITVNDDNSRTAQGQPNLFLESVGKQTVVHVIWHDTRAGKNIPSTASWSACYDTPVEGGCDSPNMVFDVYYARLVPGAKRFSRNVQINEMTMPQSTGWDEFHSGIVATDSLLFAVWPDRRNFLSIFDSGNDLFGTRILP